jgi:glycosyltransferase involved in cell wall biosynthesis
VKRVLLLAYYFPPIGGAGVQRAVKFARYLPDFGFEPIVVTGPGQTGSRWAPRDASLAGEVGSVRVVRVDGPEPEQSGGAAAKFERWGRRPSPWARWWSKGAEGSIREHGRGVDAIVATLSPFAGAESAIRAGKALGVPVVLDLRDPWALDEMTAYPTRAHRALEERSMEHALDGADAVVMNTVEAAESLARRFPRFRRDRIRVIPNGYDAADFAGDAPQRADDAFRIVHAGYLHTELGSAGTVRRALTRTLGGGVPGVDVLTRSHLHLLRALERSGATGVEVHLAGVLGAADQIETPVPIVEHGYLEHGESIALMRSADLLFLPMQNLPLGHRATIVPGKTYEYLASGRPILAAVPDGDCRDLLDRSPEAYVTRPDDVAALSDALVRLTERHALAGRTPEVERSLGRYERRSLTADLASLLNELAP